MPLSSVLGAQSLVRPGVCTSSTRPASPFEGQLIFETDMNRVVAYDGSNWVYVADTDTPPGLELVTADTFSAVSSRSIDNCFTSTYANYRIVVFLDNASATSNALSLRLRASGTDTTTAYYWSEIYTAYNSTVTGGGGSNVSSVQWNYRLTTDLDFSASFDVTAPQLAKNTGIFGHSFGDNVGRTFSAYQGSTTQFDGITFFPGSGTITGTIRVYGYRNS